MDPTPGPRFVCLPSTKACPLTVLFHTTPLDARPVHGRVPSHHDSVTSRLLRATGTRRGCRLATRRFGIPLILHHAVAYLQVRVSRRDPYQGRSPRTHSSLWQPDVVFHWQHVMVDATCHASRYTLPVNGRFKPPPLGSDIVKGFASAWPAHLLHVAVLTSSDDPLRVQLWRCDNTNANGSDLEIRTRAVDVQDHDMGGDGGDGGSESTVTVTVIGRIAIGAWLFDPDVFDDVGVRLSWNASGWIQTRTSTGDDGSVTRGWSRTRMSDGATRIRSVRAPDTAGSVHEQPEGLVVDLTLHFLDGCEWQESRRRVADRPRSRKQTLVALQDPHEAQGVGVIVKALVQQNAGASLFLRMIVCVATLLCCVHSALVVGERRTYL